MSKQAPIFIVDDDDGHAYLIELNLREAGISSEIVRFASGQEMLDRLVDGHGEWPRLILLDLNMPGVDGRAVLERLRANAGTATIPVVVLTTTAETDEIESCYRLGCNLYLTKPLQYEEFAKVIQLLGQVVQVAKLPQDAGGRVPNRVD